MDAEITEVEKIDFELEVEDMAYETEHQSLAAPVYDPGNVMRGEASAIKIHTDTGVTGEYVTGASVSFLDRIVGENPFDRERIWDNIRHRTIRGGDRTSYGGIDVALWDFAGKYYGAPVCDLLGTYRRRFPAYASTYPGNSQEDGLNSPEAYADFAEECLDMGYKAFKIVLWPIEHNEIDEHIETIRAVGDRVGDEMELMLDTDCFYKTFADARRVGKVCDEYDFFGIEDLYSEGGVSNFGHKRLREQLETPIVQGEYVRGVPQAHADLMVNDATDIVRVDVDWHGGITGIMKVARTAESLGLDISYHGSSAPTQHCLAATRNTNFYQSGPHHPELGWAEEDVYKGDYTHAIDCIDDEGMVEVPEGPGLGVEYDWDYIEDNEVRRTVYE